MIDLIGPLKLNVEFVDNDTTRYYKFFYRRRPGDSILTYKFTNIQMNRLNLHNFTFNVVNGLHEYLYDIVDNTLNVSELNLIEIKNYIRTNFFEKDNYDCFELILPNINDNAYSQLDINTIYDVLIRLINNYQVEP